MSDKFYDFRNMDWLKGIGNWESPVHISDIMSEISQKITEDGEMQVMQEIRRVVDVDKEELLKALAYDRDQYSKGYTEGYDFGYNRGIEVGKKVAMVKLAKQILGKWGENDETEETGKEDMC